VEARLAAAYQPDQPAFPFQYAEQRILPYPYRPTQARVMVIRLSKVLRRPASQHEAFSPLRGRASTFIEDYLAIEVCALRRKTSLRAGGGGRYPGYARAQHAASPLVENSIKHGLSSKGRRYNS